MVQLSKDQRVFVVTFWYETKSCVAVQGLFRQHFPDRAPPTPRTIRLNVKKYLEEGTSLNVNKNNSGRPQTARSVENVERVRNLLLENREGISCRRNTTLARFNTVRLFFVGICKK